MVSTLFTTLFSVPEPDLFGSISQSCVTLFDAFIGQYVYTQNANYELSNSITMMVHVFIANIFLMNYLIAILATVYYLMIERGEFRYKKNKY